MVVGDVEEELRGLWSGKMTRPHLIDLNVGLGEGGLTVSVLYGTRRHRRETIEKFAAGVVDALRRLGDAAAGMSGASATTFGAELDEGEMADLLKEIE